MSESLCLSLELSPAPLTAPGQRVSLAHSSSQFDCQSATQRRFQRQPSIIQHSNRIVNCSDDIFSIFFRLSSHRNSRCDQLFERLPAFSPGPKSKRLFSPGQPRRATETPSWIYHESHRSDRLTAGPVRLDQPANSSCNGPCRNRTYNLMIKSHLLCQLS